MKRNTASEPAPIPWAALYLLAAVAAVTDDERLREELRATARELGREAAADAASAPGR